MTNNITNNTTNNNSHSTKAIHSGYTPNKEDGAIIPPLHLTTTFEFGNQSEYDYSRTVNPTRKILEEALAVLDEAKYGLAYTSGSAALANIASLLKTGDTILFSTDAYGGTYRFFVEVASKHYGFNLEIVDLSNLEEVEKVLKKTPIKLIWLETPSNPLLKVTDIRGLSKLAKKYESLFVVDNTFATPILQKPLELGADLVVYSTTKYINGHSDSIGGAITLNNQEIFTQLKFLQNAIGSVLSPFDSWLTLRGLKTLELRMERHCQNGLQIANFLNQHPKVEKVYFPGLFEGKQKEIVESQMEKPGGMISIELKSEYDIYAFLKNLKYFPLAESLGGVESLIDHPASMTHGSIPKEEREKIGLSDNLLRISVGIENTEDLLKDLEEALRKL